MNVLIVEDEAITVMFITKLFRKLGHTIVGVTSLGEEVLDLVSETKPDLILMDINLAGRINGISAAKEVREKFAIPIVFATAYNNHETRCLIEEIPNAFFQPKPLIISDLSTLIESLEKF